MVIKNGGKGVDLMEVPELCTFDHNEKCASWYPMKFPDCVSTSTCKLLKQYSFCSEFWFIMVYVQYTFEFDNEYYCYYFRVLRFLKTILLWELKPVRNFTKKEVKQIWFQVQVTYNCLCYGSWYKEDNIIWGCKCVDRKILIVLSSVFKSDTWKIFVFIHVYASLSFNYKRL